MLASIANRSATWASTDRSGRAAAWVDIHPDYVFNCALLGRDTPEAFLDWPGEIVTGHPERHVRQVFGEQNGRPLGMFLKVEHIVGWRTRWRNWQAGFGWVSRSEREAQVLRWLHRAGFPAPTVIAVGEDGKGRAFLLVEEAAGQELRAALLEADSQQRRELALRVGQALAELHRSGFNPVDVSGKHIFCSAEEVMLIDWQNAPTPGTLTLPQRVRQLAMLHASLPETLLSQRERLLAFKSYCDRFGDAPRTRRTMLLALVQEAAKLRQRSSVRDQQAQSSRSSSRLVWLAGEAVCVIPELVHCWPSQAIGPPFFRSTSRSRPEWYALPHGPGGWVQRYQEDAPLHRLQAKILCKSWRSQGATAGRILMHLQRNQVPAPRLLAFGQLLRNWSQADSFVWYESRASAVTLAVGLTDRRVTAKLRRRLLHQAGVILRRLHDSFARLSRDIQQTVFCLESCSPESLRISSAEVVRLQKHVSDLTRLQDLRWLAQYEWPNFCAADRRTVLAGYLHLGPVPNSRLLLTTAT